MKIRTQVLMTACTLAAVLLVGETDLHGEAAVGFVVDGAAVGHC